MKERIVFQTAIEIVDSTARELYLAEACGEDLALRKRVESLLAAADRAGDFLEPQALSPDTPPIDSHQQIPGPFHHLAGKTTITGEHSDSIREKLSFLLPTTEPESLGMLGHYRIVDIIGEGAFGLVLKAYDEELARIVAIKIMQPHLASTSPPRKRFLREARAGAAIRHQNVVSVHGVEEDPVPYLVMEYVDGATLQDKIDDMGPLEPEKILEIACQLASALKAAHANGLIHRDIKPSNILLENGVDQRVIITDFGLARTVDDASLTTSGMLAGTPMYMSPEQAHGKPLDARSDLFSLGSVLYLMATGRPPFRASSTVAVLKRVAEAQPRPIKDLIPETPDALCQIIEKLMAQKPGDRFQSAQQLEDLFLSLAKGTGTPFAAETRQAISGSHRKPELQPGDSQTVNGYPRPLGLRRWWIAVTLLGFMTLAIGTTYLKWFSAGTAALPDSEVRQDAANSNVSAAASQRSPLWDVLPKNSPPPAIAPFSATQAVELQAAWAKYLGLPVEYTNRLGIRFRLIPPGEFEMGYSSSEVEEIRNQGPPEGIVTVEMLRSSSPKHRVMITKPFYLAVTEITQTQYEMVSSDNPSGHRFGGYHDDRLEGIDSTGNFPVECLSWISAIHFCRALSDREGLSWPYEMTNDDVLRNADSTGYYLPSEAQWEFACRAGTQSLFWTGDDPETLKAAAHVADRDDRPHKVAELQPNPFGLYDVHGNVYEWVEDRWEQDHYLKQSQSWMSVDPTGPVSGSTLRIAKGGDFYWPVLEARSSSRFAFDQNTDPGYTIGMRIALPYETVKTLIAKPFRETAISDFVEAHGLPLQDLENWVNTNAKDYLISNINVRHDATMDLVDVVAIRLDGRTCKVNLIDYSPESAERDYLEMRAGHRCLMRVQIPPTATHPARMISAWIAEEDVDWQAYFVNSDQLEVDFSWARSGGNFPVHFNIGQSENGEELGQYCLKYSPGIGHHTYVRLAPDEVIEKIEQYRIKGWRPHFMTLHTGIATATIGVIFRENSDGVAWDYSPDLSLEQYEQELLVRKEAGFYPKAVVSFVEQQSLRYQVAWEAMDR